MNRFNYIKVFNSPFKRPKLKWYFGKIAIGTPYFFPRRWVKPSQQMLIDNAKQDIADRQRHRRNYKTNIKTRSREHNISGARQPLNRFEPGLYFR